MDIWNILLVISVVAMGTASAYLKLPRYKALMVCIPLPFTFAAVSLGENVNATHVLGLLLLLGFWFQVYWLHNKVKVPIVYSIIISALTYCITGWLLKTIIPKTETVFWLSTVIVFASACFFQAKFPCRHEPGYTAAMPVWIKAVLILFVVIGLIAIKSLLGGFMTVFPMVGVLTAYESRYSLWTSFRKIPVFMLAMVCMMAVIHFATPETGIFISFALGWLVMICLMPFLLHHHWQKEKNHIGICNLKTDLGKSLY